MILETGRQSLPIILCTIATSLVIAFALSKVLHIPGNISTLVGVGSSICGGSAIAATAPVIDADDEEVAQAKEAAEAEFANLTRCTLVSMDYDPQRSYEAAVQYRPEADEAELNNWIVLFATFTTDENQAILEPNSTYEDYMYILHREGVDAPWTVMDGGY